LEYTTDHIDELIGKFLSGEATAEESAFVESWIKASDDNRRYFVQVETIYKKASSVADVQTFDADAAWNKMRSKLQSGNRRNVVMTPGQQIPWLRIAAGIIVVMGVGFFLYRSFWREQPRQLAVVARQEVRSDTLPDGSQVFLNKETKLDYAFDKKLKTHTVKLKGEAYFNVKHKDEKKFLVEADGIFIRDIGTAFNVTAYPDNATVEVVVEEGEVHFFTRDNPGIHLKAGGKGVYDKNKKTFTVEQPEANVTAYKTKLFSFSHARLEEVAAALNDVYDRRIVISENLKDCPLTVSFHNEEIGEIARIIAETLGLKVTENNQQILLEGEGCEN